jgi:hypothetical protein
MSFWKEEPITQIDLTNLSARAEKWHQDDLKRRVKKNSLKPPPNKKEFVKQPGNWRYGNKSVVIDRPLPKDPPKFEVSSEVETGQCLWCSSLINHRNKYCDKRCEGLFLRNKEI